MGRITTEQAESKEHTVLTYLRQRWRKYEGDPSLREVRDALDISSTCVVANILERLEKKKLIIWDRKQSRGVGLAFRNPLVGEISAGSTVPVSRGAPIRTWLGDIVDMVRKRLDTDAPMYTATVRGDCLMQLGIHDGDTVIFEVERDPRNVRAGDVVAAYLKDTDEVTMKRFYTENGRVRLEPTEPTIPTIYTTLDNVVIVGKAVMVMRDISGLRRTFG